MSKISSVGFTSSFLHLSFARRPAASTYGRVPSHALPPNLVSPLSQALAEGIAAHPGLSGFRVITYGQEALLLRLSLIKAAQHSLDIQYYSIQNDRGGKLLLHGIMEAADRGVRVRILIDYITLNTSDTIWGLLGTYPNISLRLFNPLATASQGFTGKLVGLFTRLSHFGRRMHNKAFIADNQVSILGGRNLGDAYFDNSQDFNFRDVDILAAGPITPSVSGTFDSFWNSREAYPIEAITTARFKGRIQKRFRQIKRRCREEVERSDFPPPPDIVAELMHNEPPLVWAQSELVADSPSKVDVPREEVQSKPMTKLEELAASATQEIIMVSPYFVPGPYGVKWLKEMVDRHVRVRMLTNSLSSTDVIAVHAGYRRYRGALLEAGVELHEMKALPGRKRVRTGRFASSSRASLHTKLYIVDRTTVFVGTMNLDPRSVELNTEIALVIHNKGLAQHLANMFGRAASPQSSYLLSAAGSQIRWVTEEKRREIVYTHEPKAGFWRWVKEHLYALLPFEDQL